MKMKRKGCKQKFMRQNEQVLVTPSVRGKRKSRILPRFLTLSEETWGGAIKQDRPNNSVT